MLSVLLIIAAFVVGFFVGRNNPSLAIVNKLIAAGKFVVAAGNKIVSSGK